MGSCSLRDTENLLNLPFASGVILKPPEQPHLSLGQPLAPSKSIYINPLEVFPAIPEELRPVVQLPDLPAWQKPLSCRAFR